MATGFVDSLIPHDCSFVLRPNSLIRRNSIRLLQTNCKCVQSHSDHRSHRSPVRKVEALTRSYRFYVSLLAHGNHAAYVVNRCARNTAVSIERTCKHSLDVLVFFQAPLLPSIQSEVLCYLAHGLTRNPLRACFYVFVS